MTDPACPWAYSALPAITALRWRYGAQLHWRVVTIGLAEGAEHYERRGYNPARMAQAPLSFGRFGMPFVLGPRVRMIATGRACRAVVAARLERQELAYLALRALHLAWFTTDALLDEDEAIAAALAREPELDAEAIVGRLEDDEVEDAYQRDRLEARSAARSPAALQERTANTDGDERYTAPTLIFEADGRGSRPAATSRSRPTTCSSPTSTPGCGASRRPLGRWPCSSASRTASRRVRSRWCSPPATRSPTITRQPPRYWISSPRVARRASRWAGTRCGEPQVEGIREVSRVRSVSTRGNGRRCRRSRAAGYAARRR